MFFFCNITTSDTFPVKIKPNMMVRILLKSVLGFLLTMRRAPQEYTESTMILRLIPTDLSKAKTLFCTLFHTAGEWYIHKDPHSPTSSYISEFSAACSSPNSRGSYCQSHLFYIRFLWQKILYLNQCISNRVGPGTHKAVSRQWPVAQRTRSAHALQNATPHRSNWHLLVSEVCNFDKDSARPCASTIVQFLIILSDPCILGIYGPEKC